MTACLHGPVDRINATETDCPICLRAERDALREIVDQINAKIGHFAGQPVAEDMPMLGIIIDVANIAERGQG